MVERRYTVGAFTLDELNHLCWLLAGWVDDPLLRGLFERFTKVRDAADELGPDADQQWCCR